MNSPQKTFAGLVIVILGSSSCFGQTLWTAGFGDWSLPANWSLGVPGVSTDANINNAGTAQVFGPGARARIVNLGLTAGGGGTLDIQGGDAILSSELNVGNAGTGTLNIVGGGDLSNTVGIIGREADSIGTATINGAGSTWTNSGDLAVGNFGTATLSVANGGSLSNINGSIGASGNALHRGNGTVTVSGANSTWANTGALRVGWFGDGILNIKTGGKVSNNVANVGDSTGSTGVVNVDGAGSLLTTQSVLAVGSSGRGDMYITAGGKVTNTHGRIAQEFGAVGAVTVQGAGSLWQNSGDISVGGSNGGRGTLTIHDQATVYAQNNLTINSLSTVTLDGGTLRFNLAGGLDRLNYFGGTIQLGRSLTVGNDYVINELFKAGSYVAVYGWQTLHVEGDITVDRDLNVYGKLISDRSLSIGDVGEYRFGGAFAIQDGGAVDAPVVHMNGNDNSADELVIRDAGSSLTCHEFFIGNPALGSASRATLWVKDGGLLDTDYLTAWGDSKVIIDGGTLRLTTADLDGDNVTFLAGTLELTGGRNIIEYDESLEILGLRPILTRDKNLTVEDNATLYTDITVDGGIFTVGSIANAQRLELRRGTFKVTNQIITVGPGGTFDKLDVPADMAVNVTLGISNHGLVTGDGEIGGAFHNDVGGELRAQPGRSLALTGTGNTNYGQIKLLGGELDFDGDLTNNAGGQISGNGTLITGGLANQGTMSFAGTANIIGNVTNSIGGKIISGGGGATIFYDDVINNGEIRTSTNGFTVFFGEVSGAGIFTGTGTVNFEGDLNPGNSPAAVSFAGDVVLGPEAILTVEIGGPNAGSLYDQINVAGKFTMDGTLNLVLINGFVPDAGQTFDFLNFGSAAGAFSSIQLPDLPGLAWNIDQLTAGVLSVGLPGDFNVDGSVDAADYVAWRKGLGTKYTQDDYNVWRTNFGQTISAARSSAGGAASTAVPEPSTLVTLNMALLASCFLRCAAVR